MLYWQLLCCLSLFSVATYNISGNGGKERSVQPSVASTSGSFEDLMEMTAMENTNNGLQLTIYSGNFLPLSRKKDRHSWKRVIITSGIRMYDQDRTIIRHSGRYR
ncbi:MAG: hypothetical protein ACOCPU_00035 [Methanohalophilus sp.]